MAALTLALALGLAAPGLASEERPSFLVVVLDDVGYGDLSLTGGRIPTPHLEELAAEGVLFDRHRVFPWCSPSRMALLTGRRWNNVRASETTHLRLDIETMPEMLRTAGYSTHMVGKHHVGRESVDYLPRRRGFDTTFTVVQNVDDQCRGTAGSDNRNGFMVEDRPVPRRVWDRHATELITDKAVERLEAIASDEAPFYMQVAHTALHGPYQPPECDTPHPAPPEMYAEIYDRMAVDLDAQIGRLVRVARETTGDNVVVVIFSDNGAELEGTARPGSSDPLTGAKMSSHEGGIRAPALVLMPPALGNMTERAGTTSLARISVMDWLPTLAALGGVEPPGNVDGLDISDLLLWGTEPDPRRTIAIGVNDAVIDHYKLLLDISTDGGDCQRPHSTRTYALNLVEFGIVFMDCLYDIDSDPLERSPLNMTDPAVAEVLSSELLPVAEALALAFAEDNNPYPDTIRHPDCESDATWTTTDWVPVCPFSLFDDAKFAPVRMLCSQVYLEGYLEVRVEAPSLEPEMGTDGALPGRGITACADFDGEARCAVANDDGLARIPMPTLEPASVARHAGGTEYTGRVAVDMALLNVTSLESGQTLAAGVGACSFVPAPTESHTLSQSPSRSDLSQSHSASASPGVPPITIPQGHGKRDSESIAVFAGSAGAIVAIGALAGCVAARRGRAGAREVEMALAKTHA